MQEDIPNHQRRTRYKGTHPRRFQEKYKELAPEKYRDEIQKSIAAGHTPAGMHRPICVNEILDFLQPSPGETGLDATLGYGGHSRELLAKLRPGGKLFATDVDPIEFPKTVARLRGLGYGEELFFPRLMNFAGLAKLLPETDKGGFDFLLADLGVSSMQLDDPLRGFTFKKDGPLDLRMNPARGKPVAELLQSWSEEKIERMLSEYSNEVHADILARAIHEKRAQLTSTAELAETVRSAIAALPYGDTQIATKKALSRVFQAFRIEVNGEFSALEQLLRTLPAVMAPGGRIAILTFHSGEDDRVRQMFEDCAAQGIFELPTPEVIRPSREECAGNPRAKCARLRCAVRKHV